MAYACEDPDACAFAERFQFAAEAFDVLHGHELVVLGEARKDRSGDAGQHVGDGLLPLIDGLVVAGVDAAVEDAQRLHVAACRGVDHGGASALAEADEADVASVHEIEAAHECDGLVDVDHGLLVGGVAAGLGSFDGAPVALVAVEEV